MKQKSYDRVRSNSSDKINEQLDAQALERVAEFEGKSASEITERLDQLDKEWDVERMLQTNASVLALSGLVLGVTASRKWLAVPGVVLPFLFQHAVQGWCPPLPVLRKLGVRTRKEIDREKYALKALRGDFASVDRVGHSGNDRAQEAFQSSQ
jgi:hypothetical protein